MAANELSVMLTAKGNLEGELKNARTRVRELDSEIKKASASGQGIGENLAAEYRQASRAAAQLSDELNNVNRNVKKAATESTTAAAKIGGAWKKTASVFNNDLVAGLSGAALVMFGKKAVTTFAQVQDASSALSATFGANGDALIKWAQQSGDALNLSQQEALNAAQTFAIFGESAGLSGKQLQGFATGLATRSADLASFFGGTTGDAVQALSSGLAGQTEVLRRYGVFLTDDKLKAEAMAQGIYSGTGALTAQQKIMASAALTLKESSRAQGDVARTADSMANQIKDAQQQMSDFQATAGETISIGLAPLLKIANGAARAFNKLSAPLRMGAIGIGLIGAAALVATPKVMQLNAALSSRGGIMGVAASGKRAALAIAAVSAAYAAAAASGSAWRPFQDDFTGPGLSEAFKTAANAGNEFNLAFNGFTEAMGTLPFVEGRISSANNAIKGFDQQLTELVAADKQDEAKRLFDELVNGSKAWGGSAQKIKDQLPNYVKAMSAAADATYDVKKANEEAAASIAPLTRAMQRFSHALDVRSALQGWRKALRDNVKKPSKDAAVAVLDSFQTAVSTYTEGGKAQAKFVADNYATVVQTIKKSGLSSAMESQLLKPLQDAKAEADKVLGALDAIGNKKVSPTITHGGWMPPTVAAPLRRAGGGPVWGPGTATSDSIPALLSNGEYVIRAAAAQRIGLPALHALNQGMAERGGSLLSNPVTTESGGPFVGSVNVTVHNPAADVDVEKAVLRGMRRAERIKAELA